MSELSVIIPTFNEEKYLPDLLHSLQTQSAPPKEIIIADASHSQTIKDIAKKYGCILVEDTKRKGPGAGRNVGAAKATGDILLFLDADVILTNHFLEKCVKEFTERNLGVASCYIRPISKNRLSHLSTTLMNFYFFVMMPILPHAAGYCIFIRHEIHKRIGGFDETLVLAEDHDYAQRAAKYGKFGLLKSEKIDVSVRRFREEGTIKTFSKYATSEIGMLFGRKQRKLNYKFDFGKHS